MGPEHLLVRVHENGLSRKKYRGDILTIYIVRALVQFSCLVQKKRLQKQRNGFNVEEKQISRIGRTGTGKQLYFPAPGSWAGYRLQD